MDGDILHEALLLTIEHFPHFQVVVRRGFFWSYLEYCELRINITSVLSDNAIPRAFYSTLHELGVPVELTTNISEEAVT